MAAPERVDRRDDRVLLVRHDPHLAQRDADAGQVLGDVADVPVLGAPREDLVADHEEGGGDRIAAHAALLPDRPARPRTTPTVGRTVRRVKHGSALLAPLSDLDVRAALGEGRSAGRKAVPLHGRVRAAAHQRADARIDLRPDRHRLHDGVRHHRHGELRPRRRVHAVRLHRPDRLPDAHDLARHRLGRARAADRAPRRHGAHRAVGLGDRARRLSPAARLVPARAADLGDRHVDLPRRTSSRSCRARATSRSPPMLQRGDRAVRGRGRLRGRPCPTSRSSSWW